MQHMVAPSPILGAGGVGLGRHTGMVVNKTPQPLNRHYFYLPASWHLPPQRAVSLEGDGERWERPCDHTSQPCARGCSAWDPHWLIL